EKYEIDTVFTNHDYEPYALQRDKAVKELLIKKDIAFKTCKDHVIFEKEEVLKKDGKPYTVFTPYSKVWRKKLESKMVQDEQHGTISYFLQPYPTEKYFEHFYQTDTMSIPSLADMGFEPANVSIPPKTVSQGLIRTYDETRNFPAQKGTSRLGVHFRFGTVSIREKALKARGLNATYVTELIWRDFYAMILSHFPHVAQRAFRAKYDYIKWRNNEEDFKKWCEGKTGYPIVDAGMRELNATGYMHNRVRMITASFLTKHLLIDWRWGEAYFAEKLLDYDLASNNGGWQWAAGSGTDAAPYFRIFNPYTQREKFDKNWNYVRKWVPEVDSATYPKPVVEHKKARERCLETYKKGLAMAEEAME
ncbi:MAG: deoxyribodipyrimidine photo-lyase, partial [Bacteroidota bacterium]